MMTPEFEISAAVLGNSDGEVIVGELPGYVLPPGFRVVGHMHFRDGQCISKRGEETVEAACMMLSAAPEFAQLVVARLRERGDYAAWRQRLLAIPSPPMMA